MRRGCRKEKRTAALENFVELGFILKLRVRGANILELDGNFLARSDV